MNSFQPGVKLYSTMSIVLVVIIVSLSTIVCGKNPESELISELSNFFDFDHNIFLLQSSVDINRFIGAAELTPRTIFVIEDLNGNNNTEMETVKEIRSKNTFVIAALYGTSFDENLELFKQLKTLQQLKLNIKIGIFFQQFVSADDIRKLFEWCKEELIYLVFAATYVKLEGGAKGPMASTDWLNIFTFQPFGTLNVMNVTASESFESYFPGLQSNFQKHRLRASNNIATGQLSLWHTLLTMMNGSYTNTKSPPWDILMFTTEYTTQDKSDSYVYPLSFRTFSVVVPHAVPYDGFSAYIALVMTDKFLAISLATIVTLMLVLATCRYIKNSEISFITTAADVINLLMNDNGYIRYQRLSRSELFVVGPLTFVGLIVMNGVVSIMQSYLTTPVLQPQIKSLEDIHRSHLPVVTIYVKMKDLLINLLESQTEHPDWSDKVILIDIGEFYNSVEHFNTSMSFLESSENTPVLFSVQNRFNAKLYYDPKIRISYQLINYRLSENFLFFERFNEIVHRMKSAGLLDVWKRVIEVFWAKILFEKNPKLMIKKMEEEQPLPSFIIYGWIASVILFVGEIIWKKCEFSRITRLPRICQVKFGKFWVILIGMYRYKRRGVI